MSFLWRHYHQALNIFFHRFIYVYIQVFTILGNLTSYSCLGRYSVDYNLRPFLVINTVTYEDMGDYQLLLAYSGGAATVTGLVTLVVQG